MNNWRDAKRKQINTVLSSSPIDLNTLRCHCKTLGGLIDNRTRANAWPLLIKCDHNKLFDYHATKQDLLVTCQSDDDDNFDKLFKHYDDHKDFRIIKMDVRRSGGRFPPKMNPLEVKSWQAVLIQLIMNTLAHSNSLHYYQGYHDIALTILFCFGYTPIATALLYRISHTYLADFMYKDMSKTRDMLKFLTIVIAKNDRNVGSFLLNSGVGEIFCLSWLITWFSHSLAEIGLLYRLFDLFLATHPFMPLYVTAAIVLSRRDGLLRLECEMAQVHQYLSYIPQDLKIENIIENAVKLFNSHPPDKLAPICRISLKNFASQLRHTEISTISRKFTPLNVIYYIKNKFVLNKFKLYFPISVSVLLFGMFIAKYYDAIINY